ncbi:uncharacterized protein MYCFIDRAFT_181964 [Pseudocercospora fijiensis CIRAD86]|uniref:Uncharacterized protein n=1 Tax=Pseudocercospora fijiensis (strain CIRAD86) TaxID=383855 RepID=M3BAY8_PSEFD|nr:uncharacterized protein MYCFIDRAFT_181964 [Pseudocercospora fijiensis CIRAD86]EME86472.1 hypothetical protein MYCFIDRAFT_181964 [Pseudocercospora fijiensis CIRAD86]
MVQLKQWSDLVFNGFTETIKKLGNQAFNINHVFQHNVIDDGVLAVLKSVIESDSLDRETNRVSAAFAGMVSKEQC